MILMNFDICIIDKWGGWEHSKWGKDTLQCSTVIFKVAPTESKREQKSKGLESS